MFAVVNVRPCRTDPYHQPLKVSTTPDSYGAVVRAESGGDDFATPAEARLMAAQLIAAADHVERMVKAKEPAA